VPQLGGYGPTKLCDGAQMAIFGEFLGSAFPASRVQHILDLHSKFALGSHHVSKYIIHIHSATAEINRGKKKIEDRKKQQDENIMSASATQGGHKKQSV